MAMSGVTMLPECTDAFKFQKMKKTVLYVTYYLKKDAEGKQSIGVENLMSRNGVQYSSLDDLISKLGPEGEVEQPQPGGDDRNAHYLKPFETFTNMLCDLVECRYFTYDFKCVDDVAGYQEKLVFLHWNSDNDTTKSKMVYSSSKDALSKGLPGINKRLTWSGDVLGFDEMAKEVIKKN